MTRLNWNTAGTHRYESGVDQGVLYIDTQPGIPWHGLTSVTENTLGGTVRSFYIDGEKYLNTINKEEFQATLTAYTYPDEFSVCEGIPSARPGVFLTRQKHKPFNLSYRTMIGNDDTSDYGYKIHILYNVLASASTRAHKSVNSSASLEEFSWSLTTLPPSAISGYARTSHVILDSRSFNPSFLSAIEDILYGNDTSSARLPSPAEIIDLIDTNNTLVVVDNGDGTYTMTAPMHELFMQDSSTFQLTWPTATFIDANSYTVSS